MKRLHLFPAFLILVSFFFAGCGGERPGGVTVTVQAFHAADPTLREPTATLTLHYINENVAPLGISSGIHKLYLDGSYVGTAKSTAIGIPAISSATHDAILHIENVALVRRLLEKSEAQTASYRLESDLLQVIDEEHMNFKTTSNGSLDLRSAASSAK
jgi:hypothetical protein